MKTFLLTSGLLLSIAATAIPPVPPMISYQGHVTVNGVDAEKKGFFKFALIDSRAAFLWSNDGTREREPGLSVALDLNRGLFSVMLGDGTLGMQEIAATVFQTPRVFLRIWFSADGRAFQQLTPDQPITTVGYAFMAENVPNASVTAAKLANSSITLSKISPAGATAGQALMFDGTSLVWQKVNVSQIDGLLGQSYASVFPDGLDNTALIDIDSVGTLEAVVTTGPGLEIQRVFGFLGSNPNDAPGPSMEFPFVFEYSGTYSNNLQSLHNQYVTSGITRNMSVIVRNLAGQVIVRWNVFAFGLSQIDTGSAGRQRYTFMSTTPANNVMEVQRDPALFPANASNNPQTDSRVEIDGFPTTVFPVLAEDVNNRTVTLTLDYTEGAGMYVWVQQTVQGVAQKRLVSHILTDSTGLQTGRVNYIGCFPISYQQFTGFGQIEKLKERVTLSYDVRNVN